MFWKQIQMQFLLRYGFCPIFINDKIRKYQLDTIWKVWNDKNDNDQGIDYVFGGYYKNHEQV